MQLKADERIKRLDDENMFAIFVALISLTSVWVGYKIDNSMKRKSEIEDSRINWIQKVREVNTNLIKAFYDFNTHQNFYSEKLKILIC